MRGASIQWEQAGTRRPSGSHSAIKRWPLAPHTPPLLPPRTQVGRHVRVHPSISFLFLPLSRPESLRLPSSSPATGGVRDSSPVLRSSQACAAAGARACSSPASSDAVPPTCGLELVGDVLSSPPLWLLLLQLRRGLLRARPGRLHRSCEHHNSCSTLCVAWWCVCKRRCGHSVHAWLCVVRCVCKRRCGHSVHACNCASVQAAPPLRRPSSWVDVRCPRSCWLQHYTPLHAWLSGAA